MNAQQKFITALQANHPQGVFCYHEITDKSANVHGLHGLYAAVNDQSNMGHLVLLHISAEELLQASDSTSTPTRISAFLDNFYRRYTANKLTTTRNVWEIHNVSCTNNYATMMELEPKTSRNLQRGGVIVLAYIHIKGTKPSAAEQLVTLQGFSSG